MNMSISDGEQKSSQYDSLLNTEIENWFGHWLDWSFNHIPGVVSALLVVDEEKKGAFKPCAMRPLESQWESTLLDMADKTLSQRQPLIKELTTANHFAGSWPVLVGDRLVAVISVIVKAQDEARLKDALASIEWCAGWIELRANRLGIADAAQEISRHQVVVEALGGILDADSFEHAALYYVNMLAAQLQCERVVLGFTLKQELEVFCQSSSSTYSERHGLMQQTTEAMQEAVDQKETLCWPEKENSPQVLLAHRDLDESLGARALMTVPLVDGVDCYGAVMFERHEERPFDEQDVAMAEALANVVARALDEKRQAQLPLYKYAKQAFEKQAAALVGAGFLWRKIALLSIVLVTLFFAIVHGDYRLAADSVLEGSELRAMSAPFDSYIESTSFSAGDEVATGDVLAVLDTRELRLQRLSWLSQMAQSQREYEDALANQERAQVQVSAAQVQRARAELSLLDYQIAQASLSAPFDGLIVSGDLSQKVGSSVRQGDVLFELVPSEQYRLALYVDEFRIGDVEVGQQGQVVLAALSTEEFNFTIERIAPMAEVRDGQTVYRVQAILDDPDVVLRAGLEGVAKIHIDRRHLISIWTRTLRDWLRLQFWRFWG